MCNAQGTKTFPTNVPEDSLPDTFNDFFINKISNLRQQLEHHQTEQEVETFQGTVLHNFSEIGLDDLRDIILDSPKKTCDLDPLPMDLLIEHLDEILPLLLSVINTSLLTGTVPQEFITPLIKKSNLDPDIMKNYRTVSNLPFGCNELKMACL